MRRDSMTPRLKGRLQLLRQPPARWPRHLPTLHQAPELPLPPAASWPPAPRDAAQACALHVHTAGSSGCCTLDRCAAVCCLQQPGGACEEYRRVTDSAPSALRLCHAVGAGQRLTHARWTLTDSAPSASCAQVIRYRRSPDASRAVSCPGRTTRVPPSSSGISVLAPSAAAASASA